MKTFYRTFPVHDFKTRAEGDSIVIEGHAALFDTVSKPLPDLGGAREMVERGAFSEAIEEDDVRLLINHDPSLILGRNKAGTLKLEEDEVGLRFEATLPNTSYARDLVESMKRGDINQNSFGFKVVDADFAMREGEEVHVVKKARLFDVSIVTYPAYEETFSKVRAVAGVLAKDKPTDEEKEFLRQFLSQCEGVCRVSRNEGQTRQCECGGPHKRSESDLAVDDAGIVAREVRKRELEMFEIEV